MVERRRLGWHGGPGWRQGWAELRARQATRQPLRVPQTQKKLQGLPVLPTHVHASSGGWTTSPKALKGTEGSEGRGARNQDAGAQNKLHCKHPKTRTENQHPGPRILCVAKGGRVLTGQATLGEGPSQKKAPDSGFRWRTPPSALR